MKLGKSGCKKTFMMKNPSTECPHCGSTKIKPRAK
jgi:rRNA maturation endonuclease Nob1